MRLAELELIARARGLLEALASAPDDVEHEQLRAVASEALTLLEAVSLTFTDDPDVTKRLAITLLRNGQPDAALDVLERACADPRT